jgi:hypothetical protein
MITIAISAVPNQSLSILLGDAQWDITLKESNGAMCATIAKDSVTVVSGLPVVAGTMLLPYKYQEQGNFTVQTENDQLVWWESFGDTQGLYYLTAEELSYARS